jgi:hypothetical protein
MTYAQAVEKIPSPAHWSCSFGNPGEGGFVEYWRDREGRRWTIENGPYDAIRLAWSAIPSPLPHEVA